MTVPLVLETTGYRAPLAVQCTDSDTGRLIGDSVQVLAWRPGDTSPPSQAARSLVSTLLGFDDLPGLRAYERARAADGGPLTWPTVTPLTFLVSVTDELWRYLPELISVQVPVTAPVPVTLYSAPARPQPPGWACVRGEIHGSGQPAGWSLITIDTGAAVYRSLADGQGRFLLYLPYPEALPALSAPSGAGLGNLTWQLLISVQCQPGVLQYPADGYPPEISSIFGQTQAGIVSGGGTSPTIQATLNFGAVLVLNIDVIPA